MWKRSIFIFIAVWGGLFYFCLPAQGAHGDHLLISEVQLTGGAGKTTHDFVEIYNPTGAPVDLNGIRLVKRTATGTTDTTLKSWTETAFVPAHGYYFWANSGFSTVSVTPDATTSGSIADNNGVALRRGAEDTGIIIDAVAWGTAANALVEGAAFEQNLTANQSIERKPGGTEGNGTDTGSNSGDFFLQNTPNPQNSASVPAPVVPISGGPASGASEAGPPPTPTFNSSDVVINELVSNPTDSLEWIELYNRISSSVDLTGWKFLDGTGSAIKALTGTIAPGGFLVFELSSARLNNSGDTLVLKAPGESVIDAVAYGDFNDGNLTDNAPASQAGQALARKSNGADTGIDKDDFMVSASATKGAPNVIMTVTTTIETRTVYQGSTRAVPVSTPKPVLTINEFVSDPEDGPEWVELYNAGTVTVELDGFWLEEGAEQKTKLQGTFVPGAFKVVEEIAGNLNNRGDIIRLKNDKGEVVDAVSYGVWEDGAPSDNAPAANDPQAVARKKDGQDTNQDRDDFAVTARPTKGGANMIVETKLQKSDTENTEVGEQAKSQKSDTETTEKKSEAQSQKLEVPPVAGQLFISEIMPDPAGADSEEWVELYWSGAVPLQLRGFKLDDEEGGSRPFTFSEFGLVPGSYTLVSRKLSGLALNNSGDAVRLVDPNGVAVHEIEYEGSVEGYSYARRDDGQWFWTAPTAGAVNVLGEKVFAEAGEALEATKEEGKSKTVKKVALVEVREEELGTLVQVQGVVAVPPGILGAQIFYMGGSGIQVYLYKKDFPPLKVGDVVEVNGVVAESAGEARLKVKAREDIVIVKHGQAPVPHEITATEVGEEWEGNLVKVQGVIIEVTKSGLTLDDGVEEVAVVIKNTTGVETSKLTPGAKVALIGIVGQTKSGYRIMPRSPEDLEVLGYVEVESNKDQVTSTSNRAERKPYAKTTAYSLGGAAVAAAGLRRRRLFTTGLRAAWFLIRGKNGRNIG